jgi:dipeptidyl-peptidase-4
MKPLALAGLLAALALTPAAPAADSDRVTGANYPLANKFSREFVNTLVQEISVSPQWIGKTDVFWYTVNSPTGLKYWKVDPERRVKEPLFDTTKLAAQLSEATKKPLDSAKLTLTRAKVSDDAKLLTFQSGDTLFEYTFATEKLVSKGKAPTGPAAMTQEAQDRLRQQLGEERFKEMMDRLNQNQNQNQIQQQDQQQQQQLDQQLQQQQQQQQDQTNRQTPPVIGPGGLTYKAQSPDKKKYVYAMKHNLYLAEEGKETEAVQLTKDGAEQYSFSGGGGGRGGQQQNTRTSEGAADTPPPASDRKTRPNVTWSPDSKAFYVTRTDSRGVKDLFLVDSIASPRPRLEQYAYPMPGEEAVRRTELFVCDADGKKLTRVPSKWKDERYSQFAWGKTAESLRFVRRDRLQRNLEVCSLNVKTGESKCQILESFDSAFLDNQPPRPIEETGDFLWWSERSGWGHYYLYGADGKLKNAVTSGPWRASRIVDVDVKNKHVYVIGNAREPGENPYFTHLYRVNMDGTNLTLLDPSFESKIADGKPQTSTKPAAEGFNQTSYVSPNKKFVVTTSSRIDHAPFASLRDDAGQVVMVLEDTDLTRLKAAGWKRTEAFSVKAADGVTDLYGNMWLPFDFDPKKQYPIIAYVYPGPQMEGTTHRFAAYSTYQQLAQLGFVVIACGHRGGSPERSKAYHSFGYFNLRDYALADKKSAIEQLASRHSFIDLDRVGIYGHSGGGFMSAAALLQPPYNTFFKAAVASAGNHDNNIYNDNWSERYHGLKEVPVDAKAATTTGSTTTGTTGGGGRGGRGGQGTGGRRPPEEITWDDLVDIDPDGQMSDDEKIKALEAKILEMRKSIEDAKKDTGTKTEQKTEVKKDETKKDDVKKDETKKDVTQKDETKKEEAKTPPKTKFEIKVPTNAELAANLKGHLMLVHGEIDNNVHPANTMRLVDALIKANKRFDLLIIPGARHGFGAAQPYFTQKMWDFFAEHLLNDRQTNADVLQKDVKRR